MTAITLRQLVRTVGSGPVVDALRAWGVCERSPAQEDLGRPQAVRSLLEAWRNEEAIQSRLTELPKKLSDLLDKFHIAEKFFRKDPKLIPTEIFTMIEIQRELLTEAQKTFGENISPFKFRDYQVPEALTKPF